MKNSTLQTIGFLIVALAIVIGFVMVAGGMITTDLLIWSFLLCIGFFLITLIKKGYTSVIRPYLGLLGVFMVASGLLGAVSDAIPLSPVSFTTLFIGGFILIIWAWKKGREGPDARIQDERSLRIGTYGIAYSWYLTYIVILLLGWLVSLEIITLNMVTFSLMLIILMPISAVIFQWYFNRKGDVY